MTFARKEANEDGWKEILDNLFPDLSNPTIYELLLGYALHSDNHHAVSDGTHSRGSSCPDQENLSIGLHVLSRVLRWDDALKVKYSDGRSGIVRTTLDITVEDVADRRRLVQLMHQTTEMHISDLRKHLDTVSSPRIGRVAEVAAVTNTNDWFPPDEIFGEGQNRIQIISTY